MSTGLAEVRKRRGLRQHDVARSMHLTPGRVSQIENGELPGFEVAATLRDVPPTSTITPSPIRRVRRAPATDAAGPE